MLLEPEFQYIVQDHGELYAITSPQGRRIFNCNTIILDTKCPIGHLVSYIERIIQALAKCK